MPTQSRQTVLLAPDQQNSVLHVLGEGKNCAIPYTPYGDSPQADGIESRLRFNDQLRELMTGCYALGNGYRMYSPTLMRFSTPDSWSPFGAGWLNAYMYCGGDPINRSDPDGHVFESLQYFVTFKIPRPTFKFARKASDELIQTPASMTSNASRVYDDVGSSSSRGGFSSNYASIKSYSSVDAAPSIPTRSPPHSFSLNSTSSIGPSPSTGKRNPAYAAINGVTINRATHGRPKDLISEWVGLAHNVPSKELLVSVQIPRAGVGLHTPKRLAVQAYGVRRGPELLWHAKPKLHASDFPSWLKR